MRPSPRDGALQEVADQLGVGPAAGLPHDLAEKFRGGKRGVLGAMVGQVMRETRGRANPKLVSDLLERAIKG